MSTRRKKLLSTLLRVSICALALWFVVHGVSWQDRVWIQEGGDPGTATLYQGRIIEEGDTVIVHASSGESLTFPTSAVATDEKGERRLELGVRTAWRNSNGWFVLAAIGCTLPVALLLGLRLHWLLKAQDISLGIWDCVKLSFAGNFLNFAAPLGSNAGDLFKAYFVSLHTHHKTEAMTTIALDRILGLGTLVAVVALITALSPEESRLGPFRSYTLIFLCLGLGGVLAYVSPIARRLVPRLLDRPSAFFEYARRIDQATIRLLKDYWALAGAILATVALQILAIGAYVLVARAVALDVRWERVPEFFAYFYIGAVVQALPGPPQGLGTVELAYRYFFAPYGSVSQILCMAFVIRVVVLLCALPGALVAMTGSYKPRDVALTDITSDDSSTTSLPSNREPASIS